MQDSDSDDSDYHDPTLNDHDEGGSSFGGVADKEMDVVPPTTEMFFLRVIAGSSSWSPSSMAPCVHRTDCV